MQGTLGGRSKGKRLKMCWRQEKRGKKAKFPTEGGGNTDLVNIFQKKTIGDGNHFRMGRCKAWDMASLDPSNVPC